MFKRFRRLRLNPALRDLVREVSISKDDLIYPLFIRSGSGIKTEVASMPGVYQMSLDVVLEELQEIVRLGIKSVIL